MKHLLLLFLFSGSLDGFTQDHQAKIDTIGFKLNEHGVITDPITVRYCQKCYSNWPCMGEVKPDTLRAICLVTLTPNGIAHARMGFVVIAGGKEVKYLDCRKRALKLPQVGWGYRVAGEKERVR